jgi:ubiquinol-cytochrome c reductase cytochrome b subunit
MGAAIAVLFTLPWIDRSPVRSMRYKGKLSKIWLGLFVFSFVLLGYLGTVSSGVFGIVKVGETEIAIATLVAQISTAVYFLYFFLMPFYTRMEETKPVPERVTG